MPLPFDPDARPGATDPFAPLPDELRAALHCYSEAHFSAGDWRKDDDQPYEAKSAEVQLAAGELAKLLAPLATARAR